MLVTSKRQGTISKPIPFMKIQINTNQKKKKKKQWSFIYIGDVLAPGAYFIAFETIYEHLPSQAVLTSYMAALQWHSKGFICREGVNIISCTR
jgi:hypothetical protein